MSQNTQTELLSPASQLPNWIDPVKEADLVARRRDIHRLPETDWTEFIATARATEFCVFRLQGSRGARVY